MVLHLNREARVPAISPTRDGCRENPPGKAHFLAHRHPANDRKFHTLAVGAHGIGMVLIRPVVSPEGVVTAFFLKGRDPYAFPGQLAAPMLGQVLEEVGVGAAEIPDSLLRCALGHLTHPGKPLVLERVELLAQCALRGLLAGGVLPLPLRQRPVVGESRDTTGAAEVLLLRRSRIKPNAVR
jgi:hypothetical protein